MGLPGNALVSPVFQPTPTNAPAFEFGGAGPAQNAATATETAGAQSPLNPQFLAPLTPAERMALMRQNREFGGSPWSENIQRYGLGGWRGGFNATG
jgi:hypothetical protein